MINIKSDFGAVGDGAHPAQDTAAVVAVLAAIQTNTLTRGGKIKFPSGHYNINTEIAGISYASELLHSTYIEGDGSINTVLDFSGAPSGSNGISFDKGSHFGVSSLTIHGAPEEGLYVGKGNSGNDFSHSASFRDLRVQECGGAGVRSTNAYALSMENIWSKACDGEGFKFDGYHTTLNLSNLMADNNSVGFDLNGITYSSLNALASDSNTNQGYIFSNIVGVSVNGIGGEQNGKEMVRLIVSDSLAGSIPTNNQDIHGLIFTGFAGFFNSYGNPGAYASLIYAKSENHRPIDFKICGGYGAQANNADAPFIFESNGGKITCVRELVNLSSFIKPDVRILSGGGLAIVKDV